MLKAEIKRYLSCDARHVVKYGTKRVNMTQFLIVGSCWRNKRVCKLLWLGLWLGLINFNLSEKYGQMRASVIPLALGLTSC